MNGNTKKEEQDAALDRYDTTKWVFLHSVPVR